MSQPFKGGDSSTHCGKRGDGGWGVWGGWVVLGDWSYGWEDNRNLGFGGIDIECCFCFFNLYLTWAKTASFWRGHLKKISLNQNDVVLPTMFIKKNWMSCCAASSSSLKGLTSNKVAYFKPIFMVVKGSFDPYDPHVDLPLTIISFEDRLEKHL